MKRKKKWLCVLFALLVIMARPAAALGAEPGSDDPDKTLAPYFYVEGADGSVDSFPLKDTKVSTDVNGVIADTYVTQTYANEGQTPINANYVFPASSRVSVHGMTMQIGSRKITAKIKEKEEAKEEFEEAKSEGKSASLLEQQRPNVFSMSVANVMPGDTVIIELHYTEMILSTEGIYQFAFPTVVGPRYMSPSEDSEYDGDQWVETPYLKEDSAPKGSYDISVKLSTGVPITDISCKSHDIKVTKENDSTFQINLANPGDFAGDRDFILNYKLTGAAINSGLMLNKGKDENFFMLMIQPPERYNAEDIPPREYIFILDVSGSMYGYPLETAKGLIKDLVSNLKPSDSFNLLLFSNDALLMSPESLPASSENIQRAIDYIEREEGGGGTELAPAMRKALAVPSREDVSRSIITITDGYISGEKEIFGIVKNNLEDTNFFSFGIGDSVNRYLVDGIAKVGLGEAFVVTDSDDAKDTAKRFRNYVEAPLLADIKVSYGGFEAYDIEPKTLPTLFAQRPVVIFGKWRGEPSGNIEITGKSGSRDYNQSISVEEAPLLDSNETISYLWARTKVENLTDYNPEEDEEAVKKQVTELGLKYSMMTPYTSFIAVMEEVRNPEANSKDVKQPLPLPQNVSEFAVGSGFTIGSEPDIMMLIPLSAIVIAISAFGYARRKRD